MIYKKNTVIIFTASIDEDYYILAVGKALHDINLKLLQQKYMQLHEITILFLNQRKNFINWLFNDIKVVTKINYQEYFT